MSDVNDKRNVHLADDEMRRLFSKVEPPVGLETRLLANLNEQADRGARHSGWTIGWIALSGAVVGIVLVGLLLGMPRWITPLPVETAFTHLHHEANLTGSMDGGYQQWLAGHGIQPAPEYLVATLSKDCVIGPAAVKHLRFRSPSGGVLNLFIHAGSDPWLGSARSEGQVADHRWTIVQTGSRLSALVIYDELVTPDQVWEMVRTMFFDPGAHAT